MTGRAPAGEIAEASDGAPVPVVIHLSGSRRGETSRLRGPTLRIGTAPGVEIRVTGDAVAEHHATLSLRGSTYVVRAEPGREVWVNGDPVDAFTLQSGDLLEIGEGGPVLRFRLYPPGSPAHKSVGEIFADCVECARLAGSSPAIRATVLLGTAARELTTQASWRVRAVLVAILVAAVGAVAALALQNRALEEQQARVVGLEELFEGTERRFVTSRDLDAAIGEIERRLSSASARVDTLVTRSEGVGRVIEDASRSVVYLYGAYGFVEEDTGRPLRYVGLGADGEPVRTARGARAVTLDGEGPIAEVNFSGTGFVADTTGALLTNHHVAVPWAYDDRAKAIAGQGLEPVLLRFVGYLPGRADPFPVRLLRASEEADLALLQGAGATRRVPPLPLRGVSPDPGDDVVVMGYPAGIRAIIARADRGLVEDLRDGDVRSVREVVGRLAERGEITPLSTRGIVGQVTSRAIVYDAETAAGGSGGPVLDLDGNVVAINGSILTDFGGSNMGVPARQAIRLLEEALPARDAREPESSSPGRRPTLTPAS